MWIDLFPMNNFRFNITNLGLCHVQNWCFFFFKRPFFYYMPSKWNHRYKSNKTLYFKKINHF